MPVSRILSNSFATFYRSPSMQSMQCMLLTSPSSVLIGGHQTKVIELDLEQLQEINQFDVPEPGCAIFRRTNKFLCAGDAGGKVTLYDPKTMKAEHVLSAHSGALSDFDLLGNLLVTCGFSSRHGSLAIDRFLMVYDMRVMRAMAPISVIMDPMFLRTIPAFSNTILVVSQTGQFQFIDTTVMTPPMMMYPVNTQGGLITSLDVSSTCQALSFGDSNGYLHLFTAGEHVTYNSFSQPTEFADPVEHLQPIHISDELTPLSIIPMMYPVNGTLLSDWPPELCQKVYRNPRPIDPDILKTMKIQHNVGYAPNPGKERRNQIPYKLTDEKSQKKKSGVPESPIGRGDDPFIIAPKKYRKVDLKYSKLGLEDFDFRHYNKTHFAGLETNIPNSYCNALLQTLYFIEPLRCALLSHLCVKEFCLSCELGFLFHMLDSQKGQTCQASNFLRAFRTIPEAAALGLILTENEENSNRVNLPRMIQSWQRFVLHQIHSEGSVKYRKYLFKTQVEEPKAEESSPEQPKEKTEDEKTTEKTPDTTPKSKKKKKKKGKKKGKETTVEEEDKEKSEDKDPTSTEQTSTTPVEEVYKQTSNNV
ncbi:hypothetical protein KUTeg_008434 [Tegillarca granosa]|uniref:Uncharacterized protein n=1 Tax=Tegillarca granosa TaxID=220873 RepID=A0ABQ9FDY8_TEGGR|nr:hypothetical protein KUTeg_008434 [Tegillarca granosa]